MQICRKCESAKLSENKLSYLEELFLFLFWLLYLSIPYASLGRGKRHQEGNTSGRRGRRKRQGETFSVQELDMHVYMLSAMQFGSHIKERQPCSQVPPSMEGNGSLGSINMVASLPGPTHPSFHNISVWGELGNDAINMAKRNYHMMKNQVKRF